MDQTIIRCSECKKPTVEVTRYMDWLCLMNFLEFLYHENQIEEVTYLTMTDRLMTFKMYCYDDENGTKRTK